MESKKSAKSNNKQNTQPMSKVWPQNIEARRRKELLCAMAFQDLEWHATDETYFNSVKNVIPEITGEPLYS